jgi:hypothetical protein
MRTLILDSLKKAPMWWAIGGLIVAAIVCNDRLRDARDTSSIAIIRGDGYICNLGVTQIAECRNDHDNAG